MIWFGLIFTTVSYIIFFAVWIVYLIPRGDNVGWFDLTYLHKEAEKSLIVSVGVGAVSTFTDFYVISIPLTTIWGLSMSMAKKVSISILFATGFLYVSNIPIIYT